MLAILPEDIGRMIPPPTLSTLAMYQWLDIDRLTTPDKESCSGSTLRHRMVNPRPTRPTRRLPVLNFEETWVG